MYLSYDGTYSVMTSTNLSLKPGDIILPNSLTPIGLGQRFVIASADGNGKIIQGDPTLIEIQNNQAKEFLGGICQKNTVNNNYIPYCACPIYGSDVLETFFPVEKILFGFSTVVLAPGEYVVSLVSGSSQAAKSTRANVFAMGTGLVMVDLGLSDSCKLKFDINAGWSWESPVSAESYPSDTVLSKVLVVPTMPAKKSELTQASSRQQGRN
jgi:hypothetical protein